MLVSFLKGSDDSSQVDLGSEVDAKFDECVKVDLDIGFDVDNGAEFDSDQVEHVEIQLLDADVGPELNERMKIRLDLYYQGFDINLDPGIDLFRGRGALRRALRRRPGGVA